MIERIKYQNQNSKCTLAACVENCRHTIRKLCSVNRLFYTNVYDQYIMDKIKCNVKGSRWGSLCMCVCVCVCVCV